MVYHPTLQDTEELELGLYIDFLQRQGKIDIGAIRSGTQPPTELVGTSSDISHPEGHTTDHAGILTEVVGSYASAIMTFLLNIVHM